MLTNTKKNFVRSIAMLLAMLMVLALCLTGCGNKDALTKAEEAKTTADAVMAALADYIKKDDTDAVKALVEAALDDSVATADELDALAAKLESYVTADDVAALIKDEVAKATLSGAMSKDEVLEILKDYYTKADVDAKFEEYFGKLKPAEVLAALAESMKLKEWNATSDIVLDTIESMQTLIKSVMNETYLQANMAAVNEKLAPLGIVAFEKNTSGVYVRPDTAEFSKMLEYTILRVATTEEMTELKKAVEDAVAVPTFENEFAALKDALYNMGELVVIGKYNADDEFEATTWAAKGSYHGVEYAEGDEVEVQVVTLNDKNAFHNFGKAHDALQAKYLADKEITAADLTGKEGFLDAFTTAYKVYEVSTNGVASLVIVDLAADAPSNVTAKGLVAYTLLAPGNEAYLEKVYKSGPRHNEILVSPLYAANLTTSGWLNTNNRTGTINSGRATNPTPDYKNTGKYQVVYYDKVDDTDTWQTAYAAAYMQLLYVQLLADRVNDEFQGDIWAANDYSVLGNNMAVTGTNFSTYALLLDTIYNNTAAIRTVEYKKVTDDAFLNALTAAMCEPDTVNNYPIYLADVHPTVKEFLIANGQSYTGFLKADLYKRMSEKEYDLLWPKYRNLAQQWANQMLNDYVSVTYDAKAIANSYKNAVAGNLTLGYADTTTLAAAMANKVDGVTANNLTAGFVTAFYNGGDFANTDNVYEKIGKKFDTHYLAMYYKNNGAARISTLVEGEKATAGTTFDAAGNQIATTGASVTAQLFANPLMTIDANADVIAARLTGSKLYVDMQIAGASLEEMKASGVPVREAFYDILKGAAKGFDEIYNRFLVHAVDNANTVYAELSDYAAMSLNDAAVLAGRLVDFYNAEASSAVSDANLTKALQQYMTGVAADGKFSDNTYYTVTVKTVDGVKMYYIAREVLGKSVYEKSLNNATLLGQIAEITINPYDTSSSEGVAMVGTEAMANIDTFVDETVATMENVLVKLNFQGYLNTARGNWLSLYLDYYNGYMYGDASKDKIVAANDYDTQNKIFNLVTRVQDTITVVEFYANQGTYGLDEYKSIYVGQILPLIAAKNDAHIALLSDEDIETVLNDATLAGEVFADGLKNIKSSWTTADLADASDVEFAAWIKEVRTPYANAAAYEFIGSAAEELDALINANTSFLTTENKTVKMY